MQIFFFLIGLLERTVSGFHLFMVAIGSKALPLRIPKASGLTDDDFMAWEEDSYGKRGRKGSMSRRSSKKHPGFDGGAPAKTAKHQIASGPQPSFIRFLGFVCKIAYCYLLQTSYLRFRKSIKPLK